MRLNIRDIWTWRSEADIKADELIDQQTSFAIPNAERIRRAKLAKATSYDDREYWENWDGRQHLFNREKGQFPTGLVKAVSARLLLHGYEVHYQDGRNEPEESLVIPPLLTKLRPYQAQALDTLISSKRGLVHGATGAGKTVLGLALINALKVPTRILCPNLTVITEWRQKAKQFLGIDIGVYSGKRKDIEPVTAISVQSAYRLWKARQWNSLNELLNCDLLLVDEVHHGGAKSYYWTMMSCPAHYRFGFSGTVNKRSDGADLMYHGALGEVVVKITSSELIANGWLSKPVIRFLEVPEPVLKGWNNYRFYVDHGIVRNLARNRACVKWSNHFVEEGRTVLILVTFIEHGKILERMVPFSTFVCGEDNTKPATRTENKKLKKSLREEVVEDFSEGQIPVLIATRQLLGEGVDVQRIGAIILMGGGKSEIRAIQEVGRGLRPFQGKHEVQIIDFADTLPYLRDHAFERAMTWTEEPAFQLKLEGTWLRSVVQ